MKYEGYLFVDHRASPGIPGSQVFGEGQIFEAATLSCGHCRISVVMNPERVRTRGHCPHCDEYLCDQCAGAYHENKLCRPFQQVVDDLRNGKTLAPLLARDLVGV